MPYEFTAVYEMLFGIMATKLKDIADYCETFDKLDIRVGKILEAEVDTSTPKKTYKMLVDFGKFGKKISYGRFTCHPLEEVTGRLVLGVLNFGPKAMGPVTSEVLILGVQYPKAESGEATFVSPGVNCKIGSKLF